MTNTTGRKNYGFVPDVIQPEDYVFGGFGVPAEPVLQPDGQWDQYLPDSEVQRNEGVESYNCTAYGTLNAIEIILEKKFQLFQNFSDRYLGTHAGTWPPGNSPHKVAETLRKECGVVADDLMPFTAEIDSLEEYYDKEVATYHLPKGKAWLRSWEFKHEWIFTDATPVEQKNNLLIEALKYGPVCVSVDAWNQNDAGIFYRNNETDNHWTTLFGYEKDQYWKIFDSYDNTVKKLEWNYTFGYAKRYYLSKKVTKSFWSLLVGYFKEIFS